jgi:hypothetical protein
MGVVRRYDTFRDRVIVDGLDGYGPILDDHTARRLWLSMGETYGFNPQREFFQAVVEDAAYQERFNPVRDYRRAHLGPQASHRHLAFRLRWRRGQRLHQGGRAADAGGRSEAPIASRLEVR